MNLREDVREKKISEGIPILEDEGVKDTTKGSSLSLGK